MEDLKALEKQYYLDKGHDNNKKLSSIYNLRRFFTQHVADVVVAAAVVAVETAAVKSQELKQTFMMYEYSRAIEFIGTIKIIRDTFCTFLTIMWCCHICYFEKNCFLRLDPL